MAAGGLEFSDLLAMATVRTRTVKVCLDGDLAGRAEELRKQWLTATNEQDTLAPDPATAVLHDELAALEAEAETKTVTFKVESIGSKRWRKLEAAHPPTDVGWRWDPETFIPAALAACVVEPMTMTVAQADELLDHLTEFQAEKLVGAVVGVNNGDDLVPKFASGTGATTSSEPSATTPASEGSPTPSS